jgi:hypothetical protein
VLIENKIKTEQQKLSISAYKKSTGAVFKTKQKIHETVPLNKIEH